MVFACAFATSGELHRYCAYCNAYCRCSTCDSTLMSQSHIYFIKNVRVLPSWACSLFWAPGLGNLFSFATNLIPSFLLSARACARVCLQRRVHVPVRVRMPELTLRRSRSYQRDSGLHARARARAIHFLWCVIFLL